VEKKLKSPLKNIKCRNSSDGFGLTPQSIYKFGTYTVRAKEEEADKLIEDAKLLERWVVSH
jgi:hypothetical protein